jgi:hypothetical protein
MESQQKISRRSFYVNRVFEQFLMRKKRKLRQYIFRLFNFINTPKKNFCGQLAAAGNIRKLC